MTEAEWLTGDSAYEMSLHIVKGSIRKLRLFAVACCRRLPESLVADACRDLLAASEASADDLIGPAARRKIEQPVIALAQQYEAAASAARGRDDWSDPGLRQYKAISACGMTSQTSRWMIRLACDEVAGAVEDAAAERRYQCELLRDIYGNPFQPVVWQAAWQSPAAVDIARSCYDSRDFTALPALARALEAAGCEQADILSHCRGDGPHVRGCWVVDLVLGKK